MPKRTTALESPKKRKNSNGSPEKSIPTKKELFVRLQHLRSTARDVVNTYLANLESGILKITDALKDGAPAGPKPRVIKNLAKMIDNLKLKPEKGRRKDLKKIERVVERIHSAAFEKKP